MLAARTAAESRLRNPNSCRIPVAESIPIHPLPHLAHYAMSARRFQRYRTTERNRGLHGLRQVLCETFVVPQKNIQRTPRPQYRQQESDRKERSSCLARVCQRQGGRVKKVEPQFWSKTSDLAPPAPFSTRCLRTFRAAGLERQNGGPAQRRNRKCVCAPARAKQVC